MLGEKLILEAFGVEGSDPARASARGRERLEDILTSLKAELASQGFTGSLALSLAPQNFGKLIELVETKDILVTGGASELTVLLGGVQVTTNQTQDHDDD